MSVRRVGRRLRSSKVREGGRNPRRGHGRVALCLVLLLGLALGAPVLAHSAPQSETGSNEGGRQLFPDPAANTAALSEGLVKYEKEVRLREEELKSPAAVAERESSQDAYSDLGPEQAQALILSEFGEALGSLNADTARQLSDEHLDHMDGTHGATVTSEGDTSLLETDIPIQAEDDAGEEAKVDLSLEEGAASFEPENPLVEVSIGKSVEEGVEVGEEGLAITQTGTEGAVGRPMGDKNVLYNEVAPGSDTDLMVSPISNGVELFDVLRSAESPEELRFELSLPQGSTLRATEGGGAEVVDADGRTDVIPKPWAKDAQGTEVPVSMTVEGDSLVLQVPHGEQEYAYPIMVDPIIYQDWGWWFEGQHLAGLSAFHPQSIAGWASMGIGDNNFPEYWERGLFIGAPPAAFGPGEWAQWIYNVPNGGTYIYDATINPLIRRDGACWQAGWPVPHDYEGVWDAPDGHWPQIGGYYILDYDLAKNQGYANMGGGGEALIVGMTSGEGGTNTCYRDLMVGGVGIWLEDFQPPTVSIAGLPTGWVRRDGTVRSIGVNAADSGLGVQGVAMTAPASIGWNQPWCAGTYENRCPETASGSIPYTTAALPEGVDPVTVTATSPTAKEGKAYGTIEVDGSAPVLSLSGSLTEQATLGDRMDEYKLTYTATDGSATVPGSGVVSTEVKVDGIPVEPRYAPGCATQSCSVSREWTLDASQFSYGKHVFEVTATDGVGLVTTKTLPFELLDVQTPPVAAYPLDEGTGTVARDVSGGAHEGTLSAEGVSWAPGRFGTALQFDGAKGCVTIPDSPALRLREEFTLEAWVRPEGELLHLPAITKQAEGFPAYGLGVGFDTADKAEGQIGTEGAGHSDLASPASLEAGVWQHEALTFDGERLRLYVDGALVATEAVEKTASGIFGPLEIGCSASGHFRGRIDEIRVYNRALEAGEVATDRGVPIQTPADAPIAAFSFDEGTGATAHDATVGGPEATLSAEGITWQPGRYGSGLKFDGANGCVTVAESPALQLKEEFTLATWVKPEGELTHLPILWKAGEGFPAYDLGIGLTTAGRGEGQIGTLAGSHIDATTPAAMEAGVWQHLAVSYDGAKLRLYLDGELVVTKAVTGANSGVAGALTIGCGGSYHFRGRIDEVRIYNRALSEGEVATSEAAPIQTPQAGPVAAYPLDEGSGIVAHDVSGGLHEGTLSAEGVSWAPGRFGTALQFDGAKGCVTVPDSAILQLSEEFTLEAWVRPEGELLHLPTITKQAEGFPSYGLGIGMTTAGKAEGQIGTEAAGHSDLASPASLGADVWQHETLTFDGERLRLYVDGALVATKAVEKTNSAATGPLEIGCSSTQHFRGRIDEVRVYNRALEAGEVATDRGVPIQTPAAGPVAAYPLDEVVGTVAHDVSGGAHEATLSAEGVEWTASGRYGGALQFDGAKGCVTVPDSTTLRLGEEFTLAAWVKPEGELTHLPILYKAGEGFPAYDLGIGLTTAGRGEGQIGTLAGYHTDAATPAAMEAGVWQHLAVSYDGAKLRLYLDGELVATKAVTGASSGVAGGLTIGCGGGYHFRGRIDEVRIYNRGLSEGEVATSATTPIQTPQAPPVAAFPLDEGEGTIAEDVSGGAQEGTLSAEGVSWAPGRFGDALKFDGVRGCVTVPDSPSLRLGEAFTLESWIRPEGELLHLPAVTKQAEGFPAYGLGVGFDTADKAEGQIGTEAAGHSDLASPASLEADVWQHEALTFDGAKLRLYVDGALVATKAVENSNSAATGPLEIGCSASGHFRGRIDEVRIYNRALSEVQIKESLSAPLPRAATEATTEPGANDAILNGWIEANGAETEYYFEYGMTPNFGQTVVGEEIEYEGEAEKIELSEAVTDLSPETTYYDRLVGDSPAGIIRGKTMTFSTGARTMSLEKEQELRSSEEHFSVSPAARVTGPDFYGMMWNGELARTEKDYGEIVNSGAKMIRLEVNFNYPVSRTAEAFRNAQAHHLTILPYVTGADFPKPGTEQWNKWIEYGKQVVEEFGPDSSYGISTWEIWNEPNMPHLIRFVKGETAEEKKHTEELKKEVIETVDPNDFATFFGRMSEVMKAAALDGQNKEGIKILAPGMFGYRHEHNCRPTFKPTCHRTPVEFLNAMGDRNAYDAFSVHPYVFRIGKPHKLHEPRENNPGDVKEVREAVKRIITGVHKLDPKKPVWVTELGFPVLNGVDLEKIPVVKPAVQKALLQATFSMMQNNQEELRLSIEHAFYYNIEDLPFSANKAWDAHTGLLESDGNRRPAWDAYRCLAEHKAPGAKNGDGETCS